MAAKIRSTQEIKFLTGKFCKGKHEANSKLSDSAAADLDFFCTLFSHDDFFIKYQKFWSFLTI